MRQRFRPKYSLQIPNNNVSLQSLNVQWIQVKLIKLIFLFKNVLLFGDHTYGNIYTEKYYPAIYPTGHG